MITTNKRNLHIYTDCSTKKSFNFSKWSSVIVTEENDYIMSYVCDFTGKSHDGETTAVFRTLLYLLDYHNEFDSINIYTDSMYLDNVYKILNPDIKNPKVKNNNIYKISKLLTTYSNLNKQVNIFWVKGHNGCYGNEVADYNTTLKSKEVNQFDDFFNCDKKEFIIDFDDIPELNTNKDVFIEEPILFINSVNRVNLDKSLKTGDIFCYFGSKYVVTQISKNPHYPILAKRDDMKSHYKFKKDFSKSRKIN